MTSKQSEYTDLGWMNHLGSQKQILDAVEKCRQLRHGLSVGEYDSARTTHPYKGFEHTVACDICKYVYRYDSSD